MSNKAQRKFDRILVTGGAGYVGSKLVPELLSLGYGVTVLDLYLYGEDVLAAMQDHPGLREVRGDLRDPTVVQEALTDCDAVVHLACISNDPSFELDPDLGKSINYDAFEPLVLAARQAGIKRFIAASSSSVYGIKDVDNVTEDMALEPLTDYSKFKAMCEEVLHRHHSDDFCAVTVRPATVCGYAPRQRLDLIVNILTNHAVSNGKIKVFGGAQKRPNIHIDDMVRCYITLLSAPTECVANKIFNAGYQNQTVGDLAAIVKKVVGDHTDVEVVPTDDNRSYHICSDKIKKELGFVAEHTVEDAVSDLTEAFSSGLLPNSMEHSRYFNIKKMQEVKLR